MFKLAPTSEVICKGEQLNIDRNHASDMGMVALKQEVPVKSSRFCMQVRTVQFNAGLINVVSPTVEDYPLV